MVGIETGISLTPSFLPLDIVYHTLFIRLVSPLRGLVEESAETTASSLRSSTMAINGSALRAFSRLDFQKEGVRLQWQFCVGIAEGQGAAVSNRRRMETVGIETEIRTGISLTPSSRN